MLSRFLLASAFVAIVSPPANAGTLATVTHVEGKALIISAHNSIEAEIGTLTAAGTQVAVGIDSIANLMMDGCSINLAAGTRYTVPAQAPCASGEKIEIGGLTISPANGTVEPPPPPHAASGGFWEGGAQVAMMAAGGLAVAGIVGFVILSEDEKDGVSGGDSH